MASFTAYLPLLTQVEGGYQKLEADSGNYNSRNELVGTNHGISAPVYERWIKRVPTEMDMRNMLKGTAIQIYKAWYWSPMKADFMTNQSVANLIFDHAVNAGVPKASKLLQSVLNNSFGYTLLVDGLIGTKTILATNTVNQIDLHAKIKEAREVYYRSLGGTFLTSWINRLRFFFIKKKQ